MKRTTDEGGRALEVYNEKRDFDVTAEPSGRVARTKSGRSFVVQKHDARRLHYDFRLEHDGVLWSWAVPKGPSLVPGEKRLAVQTEDHPIDYRDFEGTIPDGQYGGGPVIVWDRGTWTPVGDADAGMKKGHLQFELHGEKLGGRFDLIRTRQQGGKPSWLLLKRSDAWATEAGGPSIVDARPESILTGRTIDDIVAGVPAAQPKRASSKGGKKAGPKRANAATKRTKVRGASKKSVATAKLPAFASIPPQLATLVDGVPAAGPWLYEIKYDGYRTLAWLDSGKVSMASRRGLDWSKPYATIADALSRVRAKTAIFDGEVAYVQEDGRTDFQKLQNALGSTSPEERSRLVYFVFDLLFYDGVDLRDEPLSFRKEKLRTILAGEKPPLKMSDHLAGDPATAKDFFREACSLGLEGIIGKRADRPYVSGRTKDWVKVKCEQRQEMVIVGYTPPKGGRKGVGALLLGVFERKKLRYAGKVGTGFSNETLRDLAKRLGAIEVDEPAFADAPRMREVRWVDPKLVCQVRFSEWTSEGALRHPSFEGLRLDKAPKDVHREKEESPPKVAGKGANAREPIPTVREARVAATGAHSKKDGEVVVDGVTVSHPERVMEQASGLTKLDLVRYASDVAAEMLPFVAKRPLMLLRCPSGIENTTFSQSAKREGKIKRGSFVQKHSGQGLNAQNLGSQMLGDEEALYVTNEKQIIVLAQNNAVEVHGWGCTLPKWERPDWMVFDLDPDEGLPFKTVVDGAFEVRDALKTLSLESWVKTTGGKGLHVVVPIARRYDWETVRRVSETIAVLMTKAAPSRYVANMSKKLRQGKIFIDYLRNGEGATAVLPYSARARPGLTVAMPVDWKDLRAIDPKELDIVTVPKLLARRKVDPWADLLGTKQTLPRELAKG